jgi:hypothetical protein
MAVTDAAADYRTAYERWARDLAELHAVLLDGRPIDPMHRIALLRRESHSKERYEAARARLLGLPEEAAAGHPSLFDEP